MTSVCTTVFPKRPCSFLFVENNEETIFQGDPIPPPCMTSHCCDLPVTLSFPIAVQRVDGAEEVADGPGGAAQAGAEEGEGALWCAVGWPQHGAQQPEGAAADLRDLQPEEGRGMDSSS